MLEPAPIITIHHVDGDDPIRNGSNNSDVTNLPSDLAQKHLNLPTYARLEDILSHKPEDPAAIEMLQVVADDTDGSQYDLRFEPLDRETVIPPPQSSVATYYRQHQHLQLKQLHYGRNSCALSTEAETEQDTVQLKQTGVRALDLEFEDSTEDSTSSSRESGIQGQVFPDYSETHSCDSPVHPTLPSETPPWDGSYHTKVEPTVHFQSPPKEEEPGQGGCSHAPRHSRALTIPMRLKSQSRLNALNQMSHHANNAPTTTMARSASMARPVPTLPAVAGVAASAAAATRSKSQPQLFQACTSRHKPHPDPEREAWFNKAKEEIWKLYHELNRDPENQDLVRSLKPVQVDEPESPIEEDEQLWMPPTRFTNHLQVESKAPGQMNGGERSNHSSFEDDVVGGGAEEGEAQMPTGRPLEVLRRKSEGRGRRWRKMQPAFGFREQG